MNPKLRLIAFDLDGTLTESKQPMKIEVGVLIKQLLDEYKVAIMSGAGYTQFQVEFLKFLAPGSKLESLYLFPCNAAQCYTYQLDQWQQIYDNSFNSEEREQIISAIKDAAREVGYDKPEKIWGEQIEDREAQITFSALGQKAPLMVKIDWDRSGEKKKRMREAVAKRLTDFQVSSGGTTSVDVTRRGINKAFGLRKLVELTGIPISEMLYVGDALHIGGNDAVVLETGIQTEKVDGPHEAARIIDRLLK